MQTFGKSTKNFFLKMVVRRKNDKARKNSSFGRVAQQKIGKVRESSRMGMLPGWKIGRVKNNSFFRVVPRPKMDKARINFLLGMVASCNFGKARKNSLVKVKFSKIEEFLQKFPILSEKIMKEMNYQSLTNFKLASSEICEFLNTGRILWKQMILKSIKGTLNQFS